MVTNGFLDPELTFFLDEKQFTWNQNINCQNNKQVVFSKNPHTVHDFSFVWPESHCLVYSDSAKKSTKPSVFKKLRKCGLPELHIWTYAIIICNIWKMQSSLKSTFFAQSKK